jgi:hypothetical protein
MDTGARETECGLAIVALEGLDLVLNEGLECAAVITRQRGRRISP